MKKLILVLAMLAVGGASALAASSQRNRDDSLVHIGFTPVGIHLPTLLTQPLSFGVFLGEDFFLGVEFGKFSFDSADVDLDPGEDLNGEFTNVGAFIRWFPNTNSFYVLLAFNQRDWDVDFTTSTVLPSTGLPASISANFQSQASVVTAGIGNQWIFDFGLTIGVDWVVVSALAADDVTLTVTEIAGAPPGAAAALDQAKARQEAQEAGDDLNEASAFPGALIFTIGFAF